MKFRIYYTLKDGSEDSIVIEGTDEDAVLANAETELAKRGGTAQYSEEIL